MHRRRGDQVERPIIHLLLRTICGWLIFDTSSGEQLTASYVSQSALCESVCVSQLSHCMCMWPLGAQYSIAHCWRSSVLADLPGTRRYANNHSGLLAESFKLRLVRLVLSTRLSRKKIRTTFLDHSYITSQLHLHCPVLAIEISSLYLAAIYLLSTHEAA